MKIGDDEAQIEFGEAEKDGYVPVRIEVDFHQRREYIVLSQEELKDLIAHLQKQLK